MAGPSNTETVDVELLAQGSDVSKTMDLIQAKLTKALGTINQITSTADASAKGFDAKLDRSIKQLQSGLAQLKTLGDIDSDTGRVKRVNQAESFSKATVAASRFSGEAKNATNLMDALRGRSNALAKDIDQLGKKGILPKRSMIEAQEGFQNLGKAVGKLDGDMVKLADRARQTGVDFSKQQTQYDRLKTSMMSTVQDGRTTPSTLLPRLNELKDATAGYGLEIRKADADLRAQGKSYDQLLVKARQYTSETKFQQEGRLRREAGSLSIPAGVSTEGATERLAQSTLRAANAKEQLNVALRSNAGHAELAQAVANHDRYNKELAESIALHNRLQAEIKASAAARAVAAAQAAKAEASASTEMRRHRVAAERDDDRARTQRETNARTTLAESRRLIEQQDRRLQLQTAREEVAARKERERAAAADGRGSGGGFLGKSGAVGAVGRVGFYAAAASTVYGLVNTFQDGARYVVEFQDALAGLQAISAATDGQMTTLRETILSVGTNSKFSTVELVKASTTLAQAGFSVEDMKQSLGSVAELAVASGSTVAESVDLMTGAIGAFQLQTSEAARVSDLLVSSLNRSKLTVTQVAQAIQYVGATAFESNISLNELVAAAGAIANAGVRSGSTIGTGLRQFLVDLQDPSKKLTDELTKLGITQADVDVKTRGLSAVLTTLRDSGFGAAQAYAGLETRAAASFLVLKNNLDVMNELTLAQLAQGQAADAAATAMDSLSSQWQRFKNIVADSMSDGNNALAAGFTQVLKDINDAIAGTDEAGMKTRDVISREVAARTELAISLREQARAAEEAGDASRAHALQAEANKVAYENEAVGISNVRKAQSDLVGDIAHNNDVIANQRISINSVDDAMAKLLLQEETLRADQGALGVETAMLSTRFVGLSAHLQNNVRDFNGAILAVRQYRAELSATMLTQLKTQQGLLVDQRGQQRGEALGAFRNAGRNVTSPEGKRILAALSKDPTNLVVRQMALDYSKRTGVSSFEAKAMGQAAQKAAQWDTANQNVERGNRQISFTAAELTPDAQANRAGVGKVTGILGQLGPQTAGMTSAQRKGLYSPIAQQAEAAATAARERAQRETTQGGRDLWNQRADEWHSLSNQASAAFSTIGEKKTKKGRTDRSGAREARRRLSTGKTIGEAALKSAAMDLDEALEDNTEPSTFQEFKEGKEEIEKALKNWVLKRQNLMNAEIASKGMKGDEVDSYKREIGAQIDAKREEINKKIAENILAMLENASKAAEQAFERQMQPFEDGVKMAQGRRRGLDRIGVRDSVPDYIRQNADFRVEQAEENRDRASIGANDARLATLADAYLDVQRSIEALKSSAQIEDDFKTVIDAVAPDGSEGILVVADVMKKAADATGNFTDKELKDLTLKLIETATTMHNLRVENDALKLSFEGAAQIPQTIGGAFAEAATAYSRMNQLNVGLKQSLINNLGGAIQQTHSAFTTFFQDMLSKPQQVLNNLANFARSVIQTLQDMAAQALASQIFSMLLKVGVAMFGSSISSPTVSGADLWAANPGAGTLAPMGNFHGGRVIKRREGGLVTEGVSNRDSVTTRLAKDEFVTRKAAVDSVGLDFMRDVNKRGAKALQGLGTNVVPLRPVQQEMSVYLVAPEEKPQLGPNDVVAIIDGALLKDGSTKKLIRHVAQGG